MPHRSLFVKKPGVLHAVQWHKNGDHPLDYSRPHQGIENGEIREFTPEERKANDWGGDVVRRYRNPDMPGDTLCVHCGHVHDIHGWIDNNAGGIRVCPGDFVLTDKAGHYQVLKPIQFQEEYEPLTETLVVTPTK